MDLAGIEERLARRVGAGDAVPFPRDLDLALGHGDEDDTRVAVPAGGSALRPRHLGEDAGRRVVQLDSDGIAVVFVGEFEAELRGQLVGEGCVRCEDFDLEAVWFVDLGIVPVFLVTVIVSVTVVTVLVIAASVLVVVITVIVLVFVAGRGPDQSDRARSDRTGFQYCSA